MRLLPLCLFALLLLAPSAAPADEVKPGKAAQGADWPRWRGPRGDARPAFAGLAKAIAAGPEKLWQFDGLCKGSNSDCWSTSSISAGRLIIPGRHGDKDVVFCFNADTGEKLWQVDYAAPGKCEYGTGPRATPTIDGDRVYTFGAMGHLACWSVADGKRIWMKRVEDLGGLRPHWGHASSPLVYGDKVIVQAGGSILLAAFNKATGELAWKSMTGKAGYAAPILASVGGKTQLVAFSAAGLVGVEPETGKKLWSFAHPTAWDMNCATPIVDNGNVFIATTNEKQRGGSAMIALAESGPKLLWRNRAINDCHNDAVIHDGAIYCFSGFPVGGNGALKCLSLDGGKELWSVRMGCGSLLFVDSMLLCVDNRGKAMVIRPNRKGLEKVAEFQAITGHPVWTVPVICRGKLYVRHTAQLICYALSA